MFLFVYVDFFGRFRGRESFFVEGVLSVIFLVVVYFWLFISGSWGVL